MQAPCCFLLLSLKIQVSFSVLYVLCLGMLFLHKSVSSGSGISYDGSSFTLFFLIMKQILISAALLLSFFPALSFGQINFASGTWQEALAQAEAENKLLFVDAYAVWCGPCKWMDANVFTDREVGDYYNANFINYKLNMETPNGREFNSEYSVSAYPSLFFLNGDGTVAYKIRGSKPAAEFLAEGKKAEAKKPQGGSTKGATAPRPVNPKGQANTEGAYQRMITAMADIFCTCGTGYTLDTDVREAMEYAAELPSMADAESYIEELDEAFAMEIVEALTSFETYMGSEEVNACSNEQFLNINPDDLSAMEEVEPSETQLMSDLKAALAGKSSCQDIRAAIAFSLRMME